MKRKSLRIHCVFSSAGEELRQLVLRSFSLYLRRFFEENDDFVL